MQLKTKRLSIRPFEDKDGKDTFEIYRDEETCRFLLHEAWTEADFAEYFKKKLARRKLDKDSMLDLAVEYDGKVIGNINVFYTEMRDTVEIGYVFNKKYKGKSYCL